MIAMTTGMSALLMLDLATTAMADRQRSARDRDQRAVVRRTRVHRFARRG